MSLNWNGKVTLGQQDAKGCKTPDPKYGNDPVYSTIYNITKGNK